MKLQEQWNEIMVAIQAKEAEVMATVAFIPERLYFLRGHALDIQEAVVTKIRFSTLRRPDLLILKGRNSERGWAEKKPRQKDVDALRLYLSSYAPTIDDIFIHYEYGKTAGGVSAAVKLTEIDSAGEIYTSELPLISKREHLLIARTLLPGNEWCYYCKKQFPLGQMVSRRLIGRDNRASNGLREWDGRFCGDQCASYAQMSLEG